VGPGDGGELGPLELLREVARGAVLVDLLHLFEEINIIN